MEIVDDGKAGGNKFSFSLLLFNDAARGDEDSLLGTTRFGTLLFDCFYDIHSLDDLTEYDVFAVEP